MKHNTESDDSTNCPIAKTAQLVGDLWTLLIVHDLMDGSKRFGELQAKLGKISPKTLSHRLKMLEAADILSRHAYAEIPPRVEYNLTEKGHALFIVLEAMREFGEAHLTHDEDGASKVDGGNHLHDAVLS